MDGDCVTLNIFQRGAAHIKPSDQQDDKHLKK